MSEIETLSLLFDSAWYLATYQDVTLANCDPLEHYLIFGYKEGRNPNRFFDTKFYLNTYPDIAECHLNPFIHYILYGASEGRLPRSPHQDPLPPITFEVFLEEEEENSLAEQEKILETKSDHVKKKTSKIIKQDEITALKETTPLQTTTKNLTKKRPKKNTIVSDKKINKAITKNSINLIDANSKQNNISFDDKVNKIVTSDSKQTVTKNKKLISKPKVSTFTQKRKVRS